VCKCVLPPGDNTIAVNISKETILGDYRQRRLFDTAVDRDVRVGYLSFAGI
jgi:hypothetical protein